MGIIDIVLVTLGVIIVGIYATMNIAKLIRYRNRVHFLIEEEKMTPIQAKNKANQEIYNKKSKRKNQEQTMTDNDKPFEN